MTPALNALVRAELVGQLPWCLLLHLLFPLKTLLPGDSGCPWALKERRGVLMNLRSGGMLRPELASPQ